MQSYLSMMEGQTHDSAVRAFASFLGQDIVIILRILGESSGELLVGDTVIGLWEVHTGRGGDYPDVQTNISGSQTQPDQNAGLMYHEQLSQENIPLLQRNGSDMYPELDENFCWSVINDLMLEKRFHWSFLSCCAFVNCSLCRQPGLAKIAGRRRFVH